MGSSGPVFLQGTQSNNGIFKTSIFYMEHNLAMGPSGPVFLQGTQSSNGIFRKCFIEANNCGGSSVLKMGFSENHNLKVHVHAINSKQH